MRHRTRNPIVEGAAELGSWNTPQQTWRKANLANWTRLGISILLGRVGLDWVAKCSIHVRPEQEVNANE